MQMAKATFITLAALALLATSALAKDTKAQKTETEDASASCHSYRLGADGNWVQLPCQELGAHPSSQHRSPPKSHEEAH
jgi:hypothetical protein